MEGPTLSISHRSGALAWHAALLATSRAQVRACTLASQVRKACNVASDDWEDDPMIGMLLDRLGWKHDKVVEAYNESVERRRALGTGELRAKILSGNLGLDDAPFAAQVRAKMVINASVSLNKAAGVSGGGKPGKVASYDVIGSYELRYGHSSSNGATSNHESSRHSKADKSSMVTAAQFTEYMVYVTVWRWLQLELYIRRHGELGFWSMIHDISCPEGYMALWSRFRNLLNEYMPPVNEACDGLYPQMVQKILIINSPRFFGAAWVVISAMLPQHQKEKIVLLTTSQSNTKEMSKYMPEEHMPPHIKAGNSDGPG